MRAMALRRAMIEHRSKAPRFVGVTAFAEIANVEVALFGKWHLHGPIWVPGPAVCLGAQRRSGWTVRTAREWWQGMPRYVCPTTIEYLDTSQICERQHMTAHTLWACIQDGTAAEPAMWLDGTPGWLPPLKPVGRGQQ